MRWLVRSRGHRGLPKGVLEDKEAWEGLILRKKITLDPLDAIEILARAKGSLRRGKYEPSQSRLVDFVQTRTGIRLPKGITLRMPYADKQIRKKVEHALDAFLNTAPYPKPIRAYLRTILHIPNTTAPKLSNVFCQDRPKLSLSEMGQIWNKPLEKCECHEGGTKCLQTVVYEPDKKLAMFGTTNETLLRAHLNRTVFPSWEKTERTTAEGLLAMRRQAPKLRPFKFHNFQNVVYLIIKNHMAHLKANFEKRDKIAHKKFHKLETGNDVNEDMVTHKDIKDFNDEHPSWVAVRLDKNAACYAVVCFRFFFDRGLPHLYQLPQLPTFQSMPR